MRVVIMAVLCTLPSALSQADLRPWTRVISAGTCDRRLGLSYSNIAGDRRHAQDSNPKNYVFFDLARSEIHGEAFLRTKAIAGAQLKYTWRELEPRRDVYDFTAIERDLDFLASHGKRLFVQLQDVTFSPEMVYVPDYLRQDPRFHGGANRQYAINGDDEAHAKVEGWVARRWDPAVQERFRKLLLALGRQFDGRIEGINLPETAVEFGESGRLYPDGFTPARYCAAILDNLVSLKHAFRRSVTMIYANFMPGEWLPADDKRYLRGVYRRAAELGVGVGGPDLEPYKPGQMHHSYPLIRASHGIVPTAIAVQEGNYGARNPLTGGQFSIPELTGFATQYLRVDYIFWSTERPYYPRDVFPILSHARSPYNKRR